MRFFASILILFAVCTSATAKPYRVLFLGNSHTQFNDLPKTFEALAESDGSRRDVIVEFRFGGFLEDMARDEQIVNLVRDGKWDAVSLQAAKVSSSHKYRYSQEGAIKLARVAMKARSKTVLFVEWPRQDWDESDFQMNVYKEIRSASGARISPICYAWDNVLKKRPSLELWAPDGNHPSNIGSYLAACSLYFAVFGTERVPRVRPRDLDNGLAKLIIQTTRETDIAWNKKP